MSLVSEHFTHLEKVFFENYKLSAGAGHGVNMGTAREYFVQQFLREHIGEAVQIGTGEIIDARSVLGDVRNQIDLVLYRPTYPKLQLGGMINQFLAESVVATIEVKSKLTKEKLGEAICAARNIKELKRDFIDEYGYVLYKSKNKPKILSYVVAYDAGTSNMSTVLGWIKRIYGEMKIFETQMSPDRRSRAKQQSPAIDGVFIINKGFLYFDNTRLEFFHHDAHGEPGNERVINAKCYGNWIYTSGPSENNLLVLFLLLTYALNNNFDPTGYIADVKFVGDVDSVILDPPASAGVTV